jgi:hypothetical protein
MDPIGTIFGSITGYVTGIQGDVLTAVVAILAGLCIAVGVDKLQGVLTGGLDSEGPDEVEKGFQDYARRRYTRDLYSRTYEKRGIGKSDDLGGDL